MSSSNSNLPTLFVISDLWGFSEAPWFDRYAELLKPYYNLELFDSRQMGGVDKNISEESQIHEAMIGGGIDKAVDALVKKIDKPAKVLAFSVGGPIAWKACLKGAPIDHLYAVSSTRLRKQEEKQPCKTELIFGELDQNKPQPEWYSRRQVRKTIIPEQGHTCYQEAKLAEYVSRRITDFAF